MRSTLFASLLLTLVSLADDAPPGSHFDEERVPAYVLPDVLAGVTTPAEWPVRRAEILALFEDQMFGKAPTFDKSTLKVVPSAADRPFLDGAAILSQPSIEFADCKLNLMIIRPAGVETPVPVFLALNFDGNHTVHPDPAIALATGWVRSGKDGVATDAQRGAVASRWPIETLIARGYALVTAYYGDIAPDRRDDCFEHGVFATYGKPASGEWGAIAAWAWGLSRALDYLETVPAIDASKVAVMGHSRLGKTALWAGANDPRFAMVISNNSGCGGAALSMRAFGETVGLINTAVPHWFCDHFSRYNSNESDLPFDQHMLLALIAPRPLYVASAEDDQWADPRGEFLAAQAADPVFRLLGTTGLPAATMPKVDAPVAERIGYHIRSGKHELTAYDWQQYLDFAERHFRGRR